MSEPDFKMVDLVDKQVEISVSSDGYSLWINIDGQCVLRVQDMKSLTYDNAYMEQNHGHTASEGISSYTGENQHLLQLARKVADLQSRVTWLEEHYRESSPGAIT